MRIQDPPIAEVDYSMWMRRYANSRIIDPRDTNSAVSLRNAFSGMAQPEATLSSIVVESPRLTPPWKLAAVRAVGRNKTDALQN